MDGDHKATATLWLHAFADGGNTIDFDSEIPSVFATEEDALACLRNGMPSEGVVYKLTPIAVALRGPTRLRILGAKKK